MTSSKQCEQLRCRLQYADLVSNCSFLLAVIDNCNEAGGPCGELDPQDSYRLHEIRSLLATRSKDHSITGDDDPDEAYEMGKRDGYEKAVQDIDLMTGGDGEYRYCIGGHDPERHCPDAATMKARIAERFRSQSIEGERG